MVLSNMSFIAGRITKAVSGEKVKLPGWITLLLVVISILSSVYLVFALINSIAGASDRGSGKVYLNNTAKYSNNVQIAVKRFVETRNIPYTYITIEKVTMTNDNLNVIFTIDENLNKYSINITKNGNEFIAGA